MSSRSGRNRPRPRSRGGNAPRVDLGPVPVSIALHAIPRKGVGSAGPLGGGEEGTGGILADLDQRHRRYYRSTWELHLGSLHLVVDGARQLDALESLWVFLLDLVDVGYGEWSLYDGRDTLVLEAQVFGPDIQLEFTGEADAPRFRGQRLPRKALVRLRSFVEQGARAVRSVMEQQCEVDGEFAGHAERALFEEDLSEIESAVADLPLEFRQAKRHSSNAGN